jgi:hypothetical protein
MSAEEVLQRVLEKTKPEEKEKRERLEALKHDAAKIREAINECRCPSYVIYVTDLLNDFVGFLESNPTPEEKIKVADAIWELARYEAWEAFDKKCVCLPIKKVTPKLS